MSQQDIANKATLSKPSEREIRVERVFDAPRERVFAAYTDPELISQWWGPFETTTVVEELDAKPGGRWRFKVRDSDGTEIEFRGVFRELVEPERIAMTFEWDGMPGYVSVDTATFEDLWRADPDRLDDDLLHRRGTRRDARLRDGERPQRELRAAGPAPSEIAVVTSRSTYTSSC